MDRDACLRWARRHHGLAAGGAAGRVIEGVLEVLADASARQPLRTDHFQACLNTRDRYSVVKLVHVVENAEPGDERSGWDLVAGRRRAVARAIALLNEKGRARFDADAVQRVYEAVLAAGAGGWYPILGFECSPLTGRCPEVSLYSQHRPAAAALAAARALGLRELGRVEAAAASIFAAGLDLLADGGCRLKLYLSAPAVRAPELVEQLDPALRPADVLLLTRTGADGRFEDQPKAYVPLPSRLEGRPTACLGEELPLLTRGPLQRFAREVLSATRGQNLFYIGSSAEKTEIYFGGGGRVGARA